MKAIGKRLYDLLLKALSMKVVAAIVVSVVAMRLDGAGAIIVVGFMWTVVIGSRTLEKYIEMLKNGIPSASGTSKSREP